MPPPPAHTHRNYQKIMLNYQGNKNFICENAAAHSFIQPEVCPPVRGDQVAEPLVRQLVRHHDGDALQVGRRAHAILEQQGGLPMN